MLQAARVFGFLALCLCIAPVRPLTVPAKAQTQIVPSPIPGNVKTAEFDGFPFPQEIAGLSRGERRDYQGNGMGFGVSYVKTGVIGAQIYVYDRQLDLTSGDARSLAWKEVQSAIDEIDGLVELNVYSSAKIKDRSVSGPFAKAYLKVTRGGTELDSFVFVAVIKSKFVKIRLTSSLGEAASNMIAEDFAASYGRLALRGKP